MLRWRLSLGVVIVSALAALVWLDFGAPTPGVYLLPLALVVATLAAGEVHRLVCIRDLQPAAWAVYGGTLLVVAASGIPYLRPGESGPVGPLGWTLIALMLFVGAALLIEIVRFEQADLAAMRAGLCVFAVAYAGGLLGFLIHLRFVIDRSWGAFALVSLLVIVKMGDIGAYTVGRLVGRHKLAPKLSPGKTIEGFLGGLVLSALSALVLMELVAPRMVHSYSGGTAWWRTVAFGLILGAAGVVGDLAESMLKRAAGVKDSSRWMPGFGGVLDLVDSLLLAAPLAYLLWMAGLVGPGMP